MSSVMSPLTTITYIIVLLFSVIIHELAHGYMAEYLGDPTARLAGRLTLNPIRHLSLLGSVILPIVLVLSHSPVMLGWAKPVPFNPMNFKKYRKWGGAMVAVVGPMSNLILAIIFTLVIRFAPSFGINPESPFLALSAVIVLLNITLTIFNLIPVPPLDGHHILFAFISSKYEHVKAFLMRNSIILFFVVLFFLWGYVERIILFVFKVLAGPNALVLLSRFG